MADFQNINNLRAQNQNLLTRLKSAQQNLNNSIQVQHPQTTLASAYKPSVFKVPESPVIIKSPMRKYNSSKKQAQRKFITPVKYNRKVDFDHSIQNGRQTSKLGHVSFANTSDVANGSIGHRKPSMTSTPAREKLSSLAYGETPKSILKKRKIIDDNVKVTPKFDHDWDITSRKRVNRLNFSYADRSDDFVKRMDDLIAERSMLLDDVSNMRNVSVYKIPDRSATESQHGSYISQSESRYPDTKENQPLLGYDWIAGVLDTTQPGIREHSESFFKEIQDFRRVNREECVSMNLPFQSPIRDSIHSPEVPSADHQCIHTYTVNSRLFTVPLNADSKGDSRCPICHKTRANRPTIESPNYVRVSIPRSSLLTPYRVKPHRRKSFDPSDSCALSEHMLAGWQCSRPFQLPQASNIDLRTTSGSLRGKLTMTLYEAEKSISGNPVTLSRNLHRPAPLKRPLEAWRHESSLMSPYSSNRACGTRRMTSDQLLNESRNMDFDQQMSKKCYE